MSSNAKTIILKSAMKHTKLKSNIESIISKQVKNLQKEFSLFLMYHNGTIVMWYNYLSLDVRFIETHYIHTNVLQEKIMN